MDDNSNNAAKFYAELEDQFRGTVEEIKARQRAYLPILAARGIQPGASVLDIGCGRGEWLELLVENGYRASGADLNSVTVERCRQKGLNVQLADGIEVLSSMRSKDLDVVSSFHVVEHLVPDQWLELIKTAFSALRSGGILLIETPNPDNLYVGTSTFYLDPTHRNPLPSGLLAFAATHAGFSQVEVFPIHPRDPNYISWRPNIWTRLLDSKAAEILLRINRLLDGPQDYAVICRK